ncbi:MAG TPA: hypothetical protein VFK31_11980 [Rhodanobacteraceae bacterium]|nr:hypothetical protein [Rhodanobacteraceae bacterium]
MNPSASTRHSQVRSWFAACLFALVLSLSAMAMAQVPGLSAADRADIRNFTLNEDVVGRLKDVMAEGRAMNIKKSHPDMTKVHSLDDMADQIVSADPRIKPLLAKHGFTPRQFLVADLSLVSTAMTVRYAEKSGQQKAMESHLNPANVRFYKEHKASVDALLNAPASAASSQ